jgi:hypothetical protein
LQAHAAIRDRSGQVVALFGRKISPTPIGMNLRVFQKILPQSLRQLRYVMIRNFFVGLDIPLLQKIHI